MGINTKTLKKNQGLVVVLVLFVAIGGFMLYRDYSIKADKERFEQAKASIDKLYEDIVANAGEPANAEKNQSCDYNNGSLNCEVKIYFTYAVNDEVATGKMNQIRQTISQNSDDITITYSDDTQVRFAENESNKECLVDLKYEAEILSGNISCSDEAKAKHYVSQK